MTLRSSIAKHQCQMAASAKATMCLLPYRPMNYQNVSECPMFHGRNCEFSNVRLSFNGFVSWKQFDRKPTNISWENPWFPVESFDSQRWYTHHAQGIPTIRDYGFKGYPLIFGCKIHGRYPLNKVGPLNPSQSWFVTWLNREFMAVITSNNYCWIGL
jgi:hypothetical protein